MIKPSALLAGCTLLLCWGLAGCGDSEPAQEPRAPAGANARVDGASSETPGPSYVGVEVCAGCHPEAARTWRGSHHDLSLQAADEGSILGDFDDAVLDVFGVESRFFRRDGGYFVRTEGPDAAMSEFRVEYVLGVEPLQQYLVALPGGRLQALSLAWDSRPKRSGGQRWFTLYPEERIPRDDVLHWTSRSQNWNSMCADCHSTQLRKNYDSETDSYATAWAEIDVGCEACHGPGSTHVEWAGGTDEASGLIDLSNEHEWNFQSGNPIARRSGGGSSGPELDVCAPCHSRRSLIGGDAKPGDAFLDNHRPALLTESLYQADGQILDEVYVWGSFVQSRMYAAGVACSDCHDPHSLVVGNDLDAVCARCHAPATFATPEHHHHEPATTGSRCVDCHMPARTYMQIDDRRDHSFRVPRPSLSRQVGAPDACSGCHRDRDSGWAADTLRSWGVEQDTGAVHYGAALFAARQGSQAADDALAALAADETQPAIARATALEALRARSPEQRSALSIALRSPEPLVRMAAAAATEHLEPNARVREAAALLKDPVRAVRIATAVALSSAPPQAWPTGTRSALAGPLAEYREAQTANAERPEAHLNLGILHTRFSEFDSALAEYQHALRLGPEFLPTYVNLADLQRLRNRDDEGERVLRLGLERAPDNAALQHAFGLLLARTQRVDEALVALERAAELAPRRARYAYVRGVALHSAGQPQRAIEVLEAAQRRHPGDRDLLIALVTMNRDAGNTPEARRFAQMLLAIAPNDPDVRSLAQQLGD
jgi:tetratricopeptide (TPR) repeat protein